MKHFLTRLKVQPWLNVNVNGNDNGNVYEGKREKLKEKS
jgi:hypothetical protein